MQNFSRCISAEKGSVMLKKDFTTKEDLMTILKILNDSNIKYWLDGGWGVDVLAGKQSRNHRDIDINFDAQYTQEILSLLKDHGYEIETDWAPVRMELYSEKYGYIDIHPFILGEDGTAKQADLEGGWYEFSADYFGTAAFDGIKIPCISARGQKVFHTGYELRDVDRHDLKIIDSLLK